MSASPREPRTVYSEQAESRSGGAGLVRAAVFPFTETERAAVMLTLFVTSDFVAVHEDGSAGATLMLDADEARQYAAWLNDAADRAEAHGSPLHG